MPRSAKALIGQISRTSFLIFIPLFFFIGLILFPASFLYAAQVSLAWDPVTDPDVVGYKVYYGTESQSYPYNINAGNNTTFTFSNLQDGPTYYFAVTAYNASNMESGYSNEVTHSTITTCQFAISPGSQYVGSSSGTGTVSITTQSDCHWTAVSEASWIYVTSNSSGSGSQTVNYAVSANPTGASRSGTIVIAGQTFTVTQSGASQYTLNIAKSGTGTGTVINQPGGTIFNDGAVVTLTATPDVGSIFVGWSGGCSGAAPTCEVAMDSNTPVTATFSRQSPTIIACSNAGGSIFPSGTVTVSYGSSQSFTISPSKGYKIINVIIDGALIGPVKNYSFRNMEANHMIYAIFGPQPGNRKRVAEGYR